MELVVDFKKQYLDFLRANNNGGVCMGFCLVWLGDILKNRPVQAQTGFMARWTPSWFSSAAPSSIARIPVEKVAFEQLLQRAQRRQNNYELRCTNRDPSNYLSTSEILVNYKNCRQMEFEERSGSLGLEYKCKNLEDFFSAKAVDFSGRLQGTIINLLLKETRSPHAIAVISTSPQETYYLDPNAGLYKVDSRNILLEIADTILRRYNNPRIINQIIIRRK